MSTRTKSKLPRSAASAPPATPTLKAERVQLLFREHPEWQLTADGALWREVLCASLSAALDFGKFAVTTAQPRAERLQVTLAGRAIGLRIAPSGAGSFSSADLRLARALSLAV